MILISTPQLSANKGIPVFAITSIVFKIVKHIFGDT